VIDSPSSLSLSASSSISPKSSVSSLFTRAQVRLSSKFPKRVQSTLFPVRENSEQRESRRLFGHRGSSSVTSLRETARDGKDGEDDRFNIISATEPVIGYHIPWRYYHRKKVNGFLGIVAPYWKWKVPACEIDWPLFIYFVKVCNRFRRTQHLSPWIYTIIEHASAAAAVGGAAFLNRFNSSTQHIFVADTLRYVWQLLLSF
jgi:hypothetical protein